MRRYLLDVFEGARRPKPYRMHTFVQRHAYPDCIFRDDVQPTCLLTFGDSTQADKDPVIQVANVVKVQGSDEVVAKNVFTLGGCTPIVGAHVITSETEDELLWEVGSGITFYFSWGASVSALL